MSTYFREELPRSAKELGVGRGAVLIYDEVLDDSAAFVALRDEFVLRYPVTGGEGLKDLAVFPVHVENILAMVAGLPRSGITIVAAGGGSVGDFGGFVASVLQRGVALVSVPTTWLAAMDSAHGGKTALNVAGFKNQIGTFHPAGAVWVFKPLLDDVGNAETRAAYGELIKMAMLRGGELFDAVTTGDAGADELWRLLPAAVAAKVDIVALDPREETGHRRLLNLGHTFGHALEAHFELPHGVAVGRGLHFSIEWSRSRGYLVDDTADRLLSVLDRFPEFGPPGSAPDLERSRLAELLRRDKKAEESDRVTFVFLNDVGDPRLESVAIDEVVDEADRQGWL